MLLNDCAVFIDHSHIVKTNDNLSSPFMLKWNP